MHTERSMREPESFPQRRRTPSFSSSLLDSIYRSIDESKSSLGEDLQVGVSKQRSNFTYNKQSVYMEKAGGGKVRMNLRRAVMMEDWMEKQSSLLFNSSSSSSECSSYRGGTFSFSETEASFRKLRPTKLRSERTQKHHHEKNSNKTKLPISPGSRIASFLSSIFNSGNVKKAKMCYVGAVEDVGLERKSKSPSLSTASASSFSCMRKTQKGKKKSSNGSVKRTVRFYPVSVILGEKETSQPYQNDNPNNVVRKFSRNPSMKKLKSCSAMAKENRADAKQQEACGELNFRGFYGRNKNKNHEVDDEDDDALSCSSSDLFELDHLIGTARYREELPVYETTDLETNKAIANGLRL